LDQRARYYRANLPYDSNMAVLQPDGEFDMAPDIFLIAGGAELLYSMPTSLLSYDKIRNKMTVRATIWMGYRGGKYTSTLKFPNRHYIGYRGGFGKAGFYTLQDRAEYNPNELPNGVRDSFAMDLGANVGENTMPEYFSIQGAWSNKYFYQSFAQMEESNLIRDSMVPLLYLIWLWRWNERNNAVTPKRDSYADVRDLVLLNVAVGRDVQKNHIAGTNEWRQQRDSRCVLKEHGPGGRAVMDGSGDMMPNEKELALYL